MKRFNRLWVRFSLAFMAVVLLVIIFPSFLVTLISDQELIDEARFYIVESGIAEAMSLNETQLEELAIVFANETRQDYQDNIEYGSFIAIIVGLSAGVLFSRGLSRPIVKLAQATQNVANQDLSQHVEEKGATELKELAHNFNLMTDALAHSEQARRHMMADVSHELLTPLTVLEGNLRAILDDVYELNMEEIGYLYEQTNHLIHLVKDLRQLSLAEAGKLPYQFEKLDIIEIVKETVSVFTPLAEEKGIELEADLPISLPLVEADAARMRQVLHNLLANAVRHTPENGRISLFAKQINQNLQFSISDNGEGVAPELLPHLFDRFYRADSGGAGLGLAIVQAIVLGHNGRIEAVSPGLGKGATFICTLPLTQPT